MNQAPSGKTLFEYFIEGQNEGNPCFALRLFYNDDKLGVYVELSFIERKMDERSGYYKTKCWNVNLIVNILYVASDFQKNVTAYEGNVSTVKEGEIRKVILRRPVFLKVPKMELKKNLRTH